LAKADQIDSYRRADHKQSQFSFVGAATLCGDILLRLDKQARLGRDASPYQNAAKAGRSLPAFVSSAEVLLFHVGGSQGPYFGGVGLAEPNRITDNP